MSRFTITDNEYKFDKWIFQFIILLSILTFVAVGFSMNWDLKQRQYFNCVDSVCENPFYVPSLMGQIECLEDWCDSSFLDYGEYGEKPPAIIKRFPYICFSMVIVGLLLNHFIYNKGKKPDLKLNLSKEFIDKIKKLED